MTMKLYNSLTKTKEDFVPIDKEHIRIYFCGPTVYNKLHVGNFRAALVGDLLSKVLKGIYKFKKDLPFIKWFEYWRWFSYKKFTGF